MFWVLAERERSNVPALVGNKPGSSPSENTQPPPLSSCLARPSWVQQVFPFLLEFLFFIMVLRWPRPFLLPKDYGGMWGIRGKNKGTNQGIDLWKWDGGLRQRQSNRTGRAVEPIHNISEKTSHSNEVYTHKVLWLWERTAVVKGVLRGFPGRTELELSPEG